MWSDETLMINGLLATVTAEELQRLCLAHALRHRASAEQLGRGQPERVLEPDEDADEDERSTWRDQQETQRLMGFHENRAADLEFLAGHLEREETYRLGREERIYLGLVRPECDFAPSYEDEFDQEVPF